MSYNLLQTSIENTYSLLLEGKTIDEIYNNSPKSQLIFFVQPEEITPSDVDEMLEYFEYFEEYQKCIKLQSLKQFLQQLENLLQTKYE